MADGTPTQQYDPSALSKDMSFRNAPNADKVAYLSSVDPDFAKASPQDQAGYINHVLGNDQPTQFEKDRAGAFQSTARDPRAQVGELVKNVVTHPRELLSNAAEAGKGLVEGAVEGAGNLFNPAGAAGMSAKAAAQIAQEDLARKQAGRSSLYRGTAAVGSALGVPAAQMEREADIGQPAGVVGAGIPLAAATVAPAAIKGIRNSLRTPPAEEAANLYQRTVSPSGAKAEAQLESRQTFNRAAPYLAEQERQTPVFNKQPEGPLKGQKLGVMNYRQNAQAAAQTLWGQIEPRARMYETAPLEPTKSGVTAPQAVSGTITPTDVQLNPAKVTGVQGLADFTGKIGTVGEALDRIQELNSDKGVQAYEKALPDKQAELLKGDPTIEGKITAANTLRDQVFDSIEKHGNPEDANWIRGARSDYGSLTEVGKNLGNAQVPTPTPLLTRVANSARVALSPTFAREYLSRPVSTLFDLNNPNRLAAKSSAALGRSSLRPTTPPPVRVTPYNPDLRPSGPVVGPGGQAPPFGTGGGGAPMVTPPQTPVAPGPGAVNTANVTPESPLWTPAEQNPPFQMKPSGMWPPQQPVVPPTQPPVPSEGAPPPAVPSAPSGTTAASPSGGQPVPPTFPQIPEAPSPLNPQELADFTQELRQAGYKGPITADNIHQLMRQANEIRSATAGRQGPQ